ncbi:MAG: MFS transporter [Thermoanaerobacteraceae bacterium]|nr:MFS transporter [Thermoanaerobacteraceae bacterium]
MTGKENSTAIERATIRKVARRLIPFLFVLYIIAFLDRVNLGYAALEMNAALGLSSEIFGLAAGIFFIGYFVFEVPSNVLLHSIGARVWIARILISWGLISMLTAWAQNATHLYIIRFLLGVAEAGFFPGIILYITYWFRAREQARAVSLFMVALPVANIIGAPISTWVIDHVHWMNMPGWRWMFVLEGLPAIIFGLITLVYLTDRPAVAKWLTSEEKAWLIAELEKEEGCKPKPVSKWDVFKDSAVWQFSLIYFTLAMGLYGLGFWMPTIIKAFSKLLSNTQVGLIAMIPYICGGLAMVYWARRSDRLAERRLHTALPLITGSLGLVGVGLSDNPYLSIVMMTIATIGIYSLFGPFWSFANLFFSGGTAAVGIAVINSIGNLGGFLGPYALGYMTKLTGSTKAGLYFLSAAMLVGFLLVLLLRPNRRFVSNAVASTNLVD